MTIVLKTRKSDFNQKQITDRTERSVNTFLDEIRNSTPLTREEESILGNKIQRGDINAMHTLIKANLKYVVSEAKKYQTGDIPFSELLQQANIGAVEAAKRFNPSMGNKFITYLKVWVKQSVLSYTSEYGKTLRLPANQVNLKNKIGRYKQTYIQNNGQYPTIQEIANGIDEDYDKVSFIETSVRNIISIDASLYDSDYTISDTIVDTDVSNSPYESLNNESLSIDMNRILEKLSERDRTILKMISGIGYEREYDLDEIAIKFSLTKERVRQIREESLKKLKKLIIKNNMI